MRNKTIPQKRGHKQRKRTRIDKNSNDELSMLMKSNKLMIPKETIKRIISEIADDLYSEDSLSVRGSLSKEGEINDAERIDANEENENEENGECAVSSVDRKIWFKKEAYQVLHHAAESFMIDIFKGASNISALKSKGTIEPIDIRVVLHSQQNKGMLISTMFTKEEILRQKKERYERKIERDGIFTT